MEPAPYLDPELPLQERVKDLVARLTLDEKIAQLMNAAPGIPRLGVPPYDWWNECLHGVARAGAATVFPQAIGLAATWDRDLIGRVATATADEARAKHHESVRQGIRQRYTGLTFWSPNVNIFRDPRWGRGQETFGEDPYLTARLGVAFVKGLQGDHPEYLKTIATPKHFAVHSGPENERHTFDARASERDLGETYLPAFQACVQEGLAGSLMGAYNRTNGEPCCASLALLEEILRKKWGFGQAWHGVGFVVSDCGAIRDIWKYHQVVSTPAEAAALAVQAGCDLECGDTYASLKEAVEQGLIPEDVIDQAVERLFTARFRLGLFDPPERVPFTQIPYEVNGSLEHQALALLAARKSLVLLKNDGLLPLERIPASIAVIGPNADNPLVLLGNYYGTPTQAITPLRGLQERLGAGARVEWSPGCEILGASTKGFSAAIELAGRSSLAVVVLGLSQEVEGEEGQSEGVPEGRRSRGDREDIALPGVQEELLQAVVATGTPVVLVLLNGSALAINWASEHVPAIVAAWYPGQAGGTALAELLFGDYNPAGRLPVTFYRSIDQLPPFRDYRMQGRTYRYFHGEPLYPFGWGLSYTTFVYRDLRVEPATVQTGETVRVSVTVENTGSRAGEEVAQLYLQRAERAEADPLWELNGFERVSLSPDESRVVDFILSPGDGPFAYRFAGPGKYRVAVGGCSPGGKAGLLLDGFEIML